LKHAKLYPNSSVERIIAFIPPGHIHVRMILEFEDQIIILQEAVIAAIVRAYALTGLHPQRRVVELRSRRLSRHEKKHGFAEWQLLETVRGEGEVLNEAMEIYSRAVKPDEHS